MTNGGFALDHAGDLATEAGIDLIALRAERLERLRRTMRAHGMAACVLFHPPNIRYATGAAMMDVYCTGTSARYAVVAADADPVLFEWEMAVPYSSAIVKDVRLARWWPFTGSRRPAMASAMAADVRDVLRELGLSGERVGVDRVDAAGFLALQAAGLELVDVSDVTDAAREVKTPAEVELFRLNGRIGSAMMADFEAAIAPGAREYELFAALSDGLLRRQGEVVFSRLLASGERSNPWGSEARDKLVAEGDIVAVDTDAIGYEGYLIDFSRTFLCGERPSAEAVDAYRVAYDSLQAMREVLRPGMSYAEYARAVPPVPEAYAARRYDLLLHGGGLEDEGPIIYWDGQGPNPEDEYVKQNMVLCVESYAGRAGGSCGIKLEDQVLVTADGVEVLCPYPFDDRLLGR